MPGKSRHSKRKHFQQSIKSRAKQQVASVPLQPTVAGIPQPAAAISTPPSTNAPASPKTSRAILEHSYVGVELRNIGILTGIILVILIILARVLS